MSSTTAQIIPRMRNPRYHAIATRLQTLPPEVIHQIIDDLQVVKILEILSVNSHPSIDFAVQSHIHLKRLLCYAPDSFDLIKSSFKLYYDIMQAKRCPEYPQILERDAGTLVQLWSNTTEPIILNPIRAELLRNLEQFVPWLGILNAFSASPIPDRELWDFDDIPSLRLIWENIHAAEIHLNQIKSDQLARLADLIETYPALLVGSTAPSQEPHPNVHHRVSAFRRLAVNMLKPQFYDGKLVAQRIFSAERLPIIPYDRTLRVLLRIFKKFPLEAEKNILTGKPMRPLSYDWPAEVRKDWEKVTEGIAYIYTKRVPYPSPEDLTREELEVKDDERAGEDESALKLTPFTVPKPPLRTLWTPYSDWEKRQASSRRQPCFVGTRCWETGRWDAIIPLDERELRWLETYLRVCGFIRELDSVMWSDKATMKEFWITHAES